MHSSTDTWIGLAAGKQIFDQGRVPATDSFSFTFPGQPWYNQNWGTHALQYLAYSRGGPAAVIVLGWGLAFSTFLLVLLATYWRCRSGFAALIAAAVVAVGCRDFVSARPATTGFFCLAALWAMICALEGQQDRRRWWPVGAMFLLLLIWGEVHGSFTVGYGLLGLYVGSWIVCRVIPPLAARSRTTGPDGRQINGIIIVVGVSLLLTLWLGPFGLANFTHGQKIAGSEVFRGVSEWRPPYVSASFPPVWRFWLILGLAIAVLFGASLLRMFVAIWGTGVKSAAPPAAAGPKLRTTFFDALPMLIGLGMTLWARRFAPLFFIFAAPVVALWVIRLTAAFDARHKRQFMIAAGVISALAAAAIGVETVRKAHQELIEDYAEHPQFGLLERVTDVGDTPLEAIEYLKRNQLDVNLFVEWTQAGPVMFYWPRARVFLDGRAQQLYDERTYRYYVRLIDERLTPAEALASLEQAGECAVSVTPPPRVDAVLLRFNRAPPLNQALENSPEWRVAFLCKQGTLFVRRDSAVYRNILARIEAGSEWRPETAHALIARGEVLTGVKPPLWEPALAAYLQSIELDPITGMISLPRIWNAYVELDRLDEAAHFAQKLRERVAQELPGASESDRQNLRMRVQQFESLVRQKLSTRPAASQADKDAGK
ncbi:MAG: hypothetical protein HZB38_05820 [Planctomycetes bacterium]|nr:hypothetical protein [Planctomycetota bacterium]